MNRRISELLASTAVFVMIALFCASGWLLVFPSSGSFLLSGLPALAALVSGGILMAVSHRRTLSGASMTVALIYIVLAAANPAALRLSALHGAMLLTALCLFCHISYNAISPSLSMVAGMWLALGAAAIILPPLFWLAPVLAVTSVGRAKEKVKFWCASLVGLAMPTAAWICIRYLTSDIPPDGELFRQYWAGMTAVRHPSFNGSAASLCRILMTASLTVAAFVHVFNRLDSYMTSQYRASLRLLALTVSFSLLALLFWTDSSFPTGMFLMLPVAPLLNQFFFAPEKRRTGLIWLVILALLLVAERISCFV